MKIKLSALLIICFFGLLIYQGLSQFKAFSAAYLYGYPLMIMQETQKVMLAGAATENQLTHNANFPDHHFRNVVRPNVDTLYTIAWLNLSEQPQLLSVPDMGERYYISPLMDAWTNVFASVGTRTTGNKAGDYAIVGPNWSGDLPDTLEVIRAPTNRVWMIQRIQTNGPGDVAAVAQLQLQFSLASLSQWQQGLSSEAYVGSIDKGHQTDNPYLTVDQMNADTFFSALAQALSQQAAPAADQEAINNLAAIGVTAGNYSPAAQGWLGQLIADSALNITRQQIKKQLGDKHSLENGWAIYRQGMGNYGTDYKLRTGVAIIGLGALPPEEALYPNTNVDSGGQPLNGQHSYVLRFEPGQAPPVDAFWSVTLYDEEGFLVDNPLKRYALGDRDALIFNDDGSLDIALQQTAPTANSNNWLPTPKQGFAITLRLYSPKLAATDGSWPLPKVIKQ